MKHAKITKKELEEQNKFLRSMIKSLDDIKKGRIKKFEFSKKHTSN